MLLPRRSYGKAWRRILHDQTADRIVEIVSQLSHVNATIVPFHVVAGPRGAGARARAPAGPRREREHGGGARAEEEERSRTTRPRRCPARTDRRAAVAHPGPGRRAGQDAPRAALVGVPTLECVLVDGSGEAITLVFLGRRSIPASAAAPRWSPRAWWASTRASWP